MPGLRNLDIPAWKIALKGGDLNPLQNVLKSKTIIKYICQLAPYKKFILSEHRSLLQESFICL